MNLNRRHFLALGAGAVIHPKGLLGAGVPAVPIGSPDEIIDIVLLKDRAVISAGPKEYEAFWRANHLTGPTLVDYAIRYAFTDPRIKSVTVRQKVTNECVWWARGCR